MSGRIRPETNTYGAHLLVDYRPMEEADALMEEAVAFLDDVSGLEEIVSRSLRSDHSSQTANLASHLQSQASTPPPQSFSRIANVFSWRSKRNSSRLANANSTYNPRLIAAEKALRRVIGEVVEKKIILRLQARHLQARLESCIEYNSEQLRSSSEPLEVMRVCVNRLSAESTVIKDMISYNMEILTQQHSENRLRAIAGMRWNRRNQRQNNTELDPQLDEDHKFLSQYLDELRKTREKLVHMLGIVLEQRGAQEANLENLRWSLDAIKVAVKREGLSVEEEIEGSQDPSVIAAENLRFDHSRCTDCSYAYSMACDCMNHLAALQKQASDANRRLRFLVDIRERLTEALEAENGNSNVTSFSFSLSPDSGKSNSPTITRAPSDDTI